MDIEAIVNKYYAAWARQDMTMTQALEAALTELAAGYEQRIAIKQQACNKLAHDHGFLLAEREHLQERIRQLEAERGPEWKPIETTPKDGTHILIKSPTMPPTTVHWFDNGWHLSVNQRGEYSSYIWCGPNYWVPLDAMLAAAPRRCHLCDYQHGHKIGCVNNPVDIALRAAAPQHEKEGE